jgi:hypothetical protein
MSTSVWKNTPSGKTVRRRPKKQTKPFVMLQKYMIRSDAWRSLSAGAVAAYVELACRYDGLNNGRLHLSAREQAAARNCSHRAAANYMNELIEKGFVEIVRASGFNMKDRRRQATEYRLTAFHCNVTGEPPSKAFMENHFTVHPSAQHGAPQCTLPKIIEEFPVTVHPNAP